MKVLLQEWKIDGAGCVSSISKDEAQLKKIALKVLAEEYNEKLEEFYEVEIPDDHPLADMVERGTVFLHNDELDVITYPD